MDKKEIIARRILGWRLNSTGQWYDLEKGIFIYDSEFQPQQHLQHAMLIVERLEKLGFTYTTNGEIEVCFNDLCATGDTLAEAITNGAYLIAEVTPIAEEWF